MNGYEGGYELFFADTNYESPTNMTNALQRGRVSGRD
jgi:hypothetical protein